MGEALRAEGAMQKTLRQKDRIRTNSGKKITPTKQLHLKAIFQVNRQRCMFFAHASFCLKHVFGISLKNADYFLRKGKDDYGKENTFV